MSLDGMTLSCPDEGKHYFKQHCVYVDFENVTCMMRMLHLKSGPKGKLLPGRGKMVSRSLCAHDVRAHAHVRVCVCVCVCVCVSVCLVCVSCVCVEMTSSTGSTLQPWTAVSALWAIVSRVLSVIYWRVNL